MGAMIEKPDSGRDHVYALHVPDEEAWRIFLSRDVISIEDARHLARHSPVVPRDRVERVALAARAHIVEIPSRPTSEAAAGS